MNRIFLMGRLGKDPKSAMTTSQKPVCNLWVATSQGHGETEKTDWHSVVCWDKLAENCEKFLKKGSKVLIEGRMTYRDREKGDVKFRDPEIVAYSVQFLDSKPKEESPQVANKSWDDIPF